MRLKSKLSLVIPDDMLRRLKGMTAREYMNRPFELDRQIRIRERQLQGVRNLINGTTTAITGIPRQESPNPTGSRV